MKIILGKTSGFCFGVKKAVETALKYANKNICTLGPIIHNKNIIDKLKTKGVEVIKNIEDANNRLIIIRAHGVQKEIDFKLKNMGLSYIDCTCPFVKKIHKLVEKNFLEHKKIIIIGDKNHAEVIGINSYADNQAFILKDLDDANKFYNDKANSYILVAQTTFSHDLFNKIIKIIRADNIEIYNTICNATRDRQIEAENISKIVDKMIVIGDRSSSNSTKLFNICHKNCDSTFFIQDINELDLTKFDSSNKIGIMAGASTPPNIIEEVILSLKKI